MLNELIDFCQIFQTVCYSAPDPSPIFSELAQGVWNAVGNAVDQQGMFLKAIAPPPNPALPVTTFFGNIMDRLGKAAQSRGEFYRDLAKIEGDSPFQLTSNIGGNIKDRIAQQAQAFRKASERRDERWKNSINPFYGKQSATLDMPAMSPGNVPPPMYTPTISSANLAPPTYTPGVAPPAYDQGNYNPPAQMQSPMQNQMDQQAAPNNIQLAPPQTANPQH